MKKRLLIINIAICVMSSVCIACDEDKQESNMIVKQFNNPHGFSCNVYILSSEKGNLLVDPGFYSDDISNYLKSIGGLDIILLTHGHWDHTLGLDELKACYPDAPVYLNKLDGNFLRDPHLNASEVKNFSLILNSQPVLIEEGVYTIGGYDIEMIHTPGHTIGNSIYYLKEENLLFAGDFILADIPTTTCRPTGDEEQENNSIQKFKALSFPDDMKIYFGHGKNVTYKEMMEINPCFEK